MRKLDKEETQTVAIDIIAAEMISIADEIEDLPQFDPSELTNEKIVQMQKIDFCSQRLRDLSSLILQLAEQSHEDRITLLKLMAANAKLEHTRELFQKDRKCS